MTTRGLKPVDGRKSFYNKAIVCTEDDGTETLLSYGTPVIKRDRNGNLIRLWNGYSVTTMRHVNAFCGINKSIWMKMEVK